MSKKWGFFFTFLGAIIGVLMTRDPRNKKKMFVLGPYWASIRLAIGEYDHLFFYHTERVGSGHSYSGQSYYGTVLGTRVSVTKRHNPIFAAETVVYLLQKVLINVNWGMRSGRFMQPDAPIYLGQDYDEFCRLKHLRDDIELQKWFNDIKGD